eukprot:PITA_10027
MRTWEVCKAAFPRSDSKANGVLGFIHSDICGLMSTRALNGVQFFVTFIDDYSRKTWIYFLKTIDEVFDRFKEFKALVENATRKKMKDFPRFLRAEACNTAVYIQNRTPHRALGKKTPKGVFTGKKPEVSHFKIFGSIAYCHVLDEKRTKLDQTAEKGLLVGSSRAGNPVRTQETKQQWQDEEELVEPPTTSGRASREVLQTLRDAEEFVRAPRMSKREHRQPDRYQALVAQVVEPSSFQEATQHQVWVDAMVEEYNSIMTNNVWEVVSRPEDRLVVGSRWIYKIKYAANGSVGKYKARFVAKGYAQKEGIDYEETFASVARYTSIGSVIFLAAQMGWEIH